LKVTKVPQKNFESEHTKAKIYENIHKIQLNFVKTFIHLLNIVKIHKVS
jgi:hypothetical protein